MQQAYQTLRIVSAAQTVRIVLAAHPGERVLRELIRACAGFRTDRDNGIKAVVLDFNVRASGESEPPFPEQLQQAREAVRTIPQPVLAVVRLDLSAAACQLLAEADFTLLASEARLPLLTSETASTQEKAGDRLIGGAGAERLGYATWTASSDELPREMERILDLLRSKSAIALRHAKASVRLAVEQAGDNLAALRRVNAYYLANVMQTADAREGLQAFLEKRQPQWRNH